MYPFGLPELSAAIRRPVRHRTFVSFVLFVVKKTVLNLVLTPTSGLPISICGDSPPCAASHLRGSS